MLIDLTRIERSKVMDIKKYERHSQNVLQMIREAGLEEITNYTAYGETYNLDTSNHLSISIRFMFKPRGYKKQVQEFIDAVKKEMTTTQKESEITNKVDGYVEKKEKYTIFEMADDMDALLDPERIQTDEDMDRAVALVEKQEGAIALKCDNFVKYKIQQKAMVETIKAEISRQRVRQKHFEREVEKADNLGKRILERLGKNKIETPSGTIKTRLSHPLVITGKVPNKYLNTSITISYDDLKSALEYGVELGEDSKELLTDILGLSQKTQTVNKNLIKEDIKKGEKIDFAYIKDEVKGVIE